MGILETALASAWLFILGAWFLGISKRLAGALFVAAGVATFVFLAAS